MRTEQRHTCNDKVLHLKKLKKEKNMLLILLVEADLTDKFVYILSVVILYI